MTNEQHEKELQQRLEAIDALPADEVPSGWSRRNWVQREAIAFALLDRSPAKPREESGGE